MKLTEDQTAREIEAIRPILEQITQKWSILVLTVLCEKPTRFNALKRRLGGITQRALTETLRRLQRNGFLDRSVTTTSPISVVYSVTPLGRSLQTPFSSILEWALDHEEDMRKAQVAFDDASAEEMR